MQTQGVALNAKAISAFRLLPRELEEAVVIQASDVAGPITKGDRFLSAGKSAQALEQYEKAVAEASDSDQLLSRILDDRMAAARVHQEFLAGDWVPLRFDPGLPGWRIIGGAWLASSSTDIRGGFDGQGDVALIHRAPFGARFELQCTVHTGRLRYEYPANAGIIFAYSNTFGSETWQSARIYPSEKVARVGYRFFLSKCPSVPIGKRQSSYVLHAMYWDGELVLNVDGTEVFAGKLQTGERELGAMVGFGGWASRPNGFARFENATIRRLAEKPAALNVGTTKTVSEP
jgi:hypothetical protein